ncbi:MAG: tyrosine-type recombinase/integrase [Alphaproteobacteria bacterium]|nr:tyrosine-type recombinase/integrase [Alphaproteobacteria bacterium]
MTKLAYEFLILTALRTGEIRGALWSEIDLTKAEWFIPRERMKAKADHRVPLTPRMLEVLAEAKDYAVDSGTLVLPSQRSDLMLSDNTFRKLNENTGCSCYFEGPWTLWTPQCTRIFEIASFRHHPAPSLRSQS